MGAGVYIIGMVKTNTKIFCKETIEKLIKDCPGGSYLVLRSKHVVLRGRLIIAIGYKYTARRVIYFIVIADAWSTKAEIPYLSKYPDPFSNVPIHPVHNPLVVSKFFGYVDEVDSHNK